MPQKRGYEAASAYLRERAPGAARGGKAAGAPGVAAVEPDALAACAEAWLVSLQARNYAAPTVAGRRRVLLAFIAWAAERDLARVGEITRPVLEAYQRALARPPAEGRAAAWSTQRNRLTILQGWFRWLTRQNILLHNPASEIELPRPERRLPVAGLTREELARLFAVPDLADPLGLRDRAMLELLYATGLRRAELCRLECADVNAGRGTVTVRQGKGRKDRVVPLGAKAAEWVERYARESRPLLVVDPRERALFLTGYGGPFNPDVVTRMVAAWMKRAGMENRGSCHLLRHTCATHMLEGGADIRFIQQQLGHANLETTAIYTEVTIRQLLEVHARCHPSGRLPIPTTTPATATPPAQTT